MDLVRRLAISYYEKIAVISESHHIYLVQHRETKKICIKKILDVYNYEIYEFLYFHPIEGTPKIIEYGEEDQRLILIEEYISGESLTDKIQNVDLTKDQILKYMIDLCEIVKQLHGLPQPVIHRDIKPANLMVTHYDRLVLLDFNAAKYYKAEEANDTVLLGTQGYAAPEQYGFGSSSPQTDIYAMGILLKEMLHAIRQSDPAFDEMIDRCTRMTPSERYQSVAELEAVLRKVSGQNGQPKAQTDHAVPRGETNESPHIQPGIRFGGPSEEETERNQGSQRTKSTDIERPHATDSGYALPGFRSKTPWKMVVAILGYLFIFWCGMTMDVKDAAGIMLWIDRVLYVLMMLSVVFGCFNYRNIQAIFPLCKSENRLVRYTGITLLILAMFAVLTLIMNILRDVF